MSFSRTQILAEIEEKSKDLAAFMAARDLIRKRVVEVKDSQSNLTPLPNWSGTDAVLGSMDLAIHSMERTLAELDLILSSYDNAKPNLRLVGNYDE